MGGSNTIALMLPGPVVKVVVQRGNAAGEAAAVMIATIKDSEDKRHALALRQTGSGIHRLFEAIIGTKRLVQCGEKAARLLFR